MDQNVKQQIIESLNNTTNVLVTVSSNPTVDELAACVGLTLVLNKLDKHSTAVFSGKIPSTIEFLKPEETLEKNTDSLRDFIIALDKAKADKLRYKVEDKVVKIFITPYKTSISDKDLDFSQGDFNVDVILALGVHKREELDNAIVSHGKILHDATIICVNHDQVSNLGAINWQDAEASSLCEMVVDLAETMKPDNFDEQTATALLTGIVAQTDRFSNEKTSPRTMSLSAKLMAAGANQQLVASKLQTVLDKNDVASGAGSAEDGGQPDAVEGSDGSLRITHKTAASEDEEEKSEESENSEAQEAKPGELKLEHTSKDLEVDDAEEETANGALQEEDLPAEPKTTEELPSDAPKIRDVKSSPADHISANGELMDDEDTKEEAPSTGGTLTANTAPEGLDPSTDELSLPTPVDAPMLSHNAPQEVEDNASKDEAPAPQPTDELAPTASNEEVNGALPEEEDEPVPLNESLSDKPAAAQPAPAALAQEPVAPIVPSAQPPVLAPLADTPAPAAPLEPTPQAAFAPTPPVLEPLPSTPDAVAANGGLPTNLVPLDQGPPPEQTASGTPQPLAPPPVPPPFTGGFPPAQPPTTPGQSPLPPAPGL